MSNRPMVPSRPAAGAAILMLCLACGGGDSTPPYVVPPTITLFINNGPILTGASARLTAHFANGVGLVEPGDLPIQSGVDLTVGPLTTTTYTLVVKNSQGTTAQATTTVTVKPLPATLNVTVNAPAQGAAKVKVLGPSGYVNKVAATTSLTGLTPGSYTVVPSGVWDDAGKAYQAQGAQVVTLDDGATGSATVTYTAAPTLTFTLPDGTLSGTSTALSLVLIPAGSYLMGAVPFEQDFADEELPQHPVTLTHDFYLATFPTTQAQWRAVAGTTPSSFAVAGGGATTDNFLRPVERVSWNGVTAFLAALNTATAATRPTGMVFRLPTEAEWEYACRAGTTTRFYWGNDPAYADLDAYAWWSGNSGATTHPVGDLGAWSANPFALFDMNGNVFEWCSDWYGPYTGDTATDPTGPATGTQRVVRGGAWFFPSALCRSANRSHSGPDDAFSSIGFRVVLAPAP